ncbi:hypothetical protein EJB05_08376, partial [Eragrostis curvula]
MELGRSAGDMIGDDILGSTGIERSEDTGSSSASKSSDGSSSSGGDSDSSSDSGSSYGATKDDNSLDVSLAMMSGLREYNPEELRTTLEANSAPNLADLLLRQGQMITQASQVLRKKLETEVGFGGVPPELVALREEKSCWETKEASFEEEIARLKRDLQEKTDSFAAYKKDSERKHAAALEKVEDKRAALEEALKAETERLRSGASGLFRSSELLARYGRQPRPLPAGDELNLDSLLSWVEKELQSVPSLVNNMCEHGAKTCLYALLDILAKKKVGDFHELGYSTFPSEAIEDADPNTLDKGVSIVAKRFWRFYWSRHGSAAACASVVSRANEAKEKKRKEAGGPVSSSNPSSADEQGKAKKAKSAVVAEASSAARPRSATPSEPAAKVSEEEAAVEPLCYQNGRICATHAAYRLVTKIVGNDGLSRFWGYVFNDYFGARAEVTQLFQRGRRRMLRGPPLVVPKAEATESEEIYDVPWVYDDSREDGLPGMFLEL